jgi:hypothetical protein
MLKNVDIFRAAGSPHNLTKPDILHKLPSAAAVEVERLEDDMNGCRAG